MKQIYATILIAAFAIVANYTADAQDINYDWAHFHCYSQANANVKQRPKAVLMGDSITQFWYSTDPGFFEDNNFAGRGIAGQTTMEMLVRFRADVVALKPKYVIILAGTNDIARNNGLISDVNIVGNIISMCEIAKANKIKPVICSILPVYTYSWRPELGVVAGTIQDVNKMLKEYSDSHKIPYIDYWSALADERGGLPEVYSNDGCHPLMAGFAIMEDLVLKTIK